MIKGCEALDSSQSHTLPGLWYVLLFLRIFKFKTFHMKSKLRASPGKNESCVFCTQSPAGQGHLGIRESHCLLWMEFVCSEVSQHTEGKGQQLLGIRLDPCCMSSRHLATGAVTTKERSEDTLKCENPGNMPL